MTRNEAAVRDTLDAFAGRMRAVHALRGRAGGGTTTSRVPSGRLASRSLVTTVAS